ncbi:MAG TPA: arylamine N-acetyltransferase, partial [Euzebya sp.]|nr:arylamine N-acetyltransferase [Euzebya sp.]
RRATVRMVGALERLLTPAEVGAYLRRLGLPPVLGPPDEGLLRLLQRAHARVVPFENLDIEAGVPIRLDLDHLLDKVVRRWRGGFCYELNGLFHALLVNLGFDAWLVEARTRGEDTGGQKGALGPRFDHTRILVAVGDRRLLVDVGDGASPLVPMVLDDDRPVDVGPGVLRLVADGEGWRTDIRRADGGWSRDWWFDDVPQPLEAFTDRCRYQQFDPGSHFAQGLICCVPTPRGRITLAKDRLITTVDGQRTEKEVADVSVPLWEVFGIRWPEGVAAAG